MKAVCKTHSAMKKARSAAPKKNTDNTLDPNVLKYQGTKKFAPRYFGQSTIYTDMGKYSWRLKLRPGDLHEKYFPFTESPHKQWKLMVAAAKKVQRKTA